MIYDTLENLAQYMGLDENLDTAIDWLCNAGADALKALPLGRTDIDGDNVYVNVVEVPPAPAEKLDFESHSRYADLQLDLQGSELFQVAFGELKKKKLYDAGKDYALWKGDVSGAGVLGTGRFAVFFPEEAHKPGIQAAGTGKVRRAIFKVLMDSAEEADTETED